MITLEDMQARHRALRAQLESLDPAVTGEVPPRERDRARGLLADDVDGSSDDAAAMAPKRAPRRAAYGACPPSRSSAAVTFAWHRAAALMKAPSQRPGGAWRPTIARTRSWMTSSPRSARTRDVATCARSGAARARTTIMFEDARVPRRARAAQGPRRPDRDPRTGFPDKVYPRQPGRGWEDEPEQPARGQRLPGGIGADVPRPVKAQTHEACPRLHTHGTLSTARWSRPVARRHASAIKAATRFREGCAGVDRNCAKLRARLRPSGRFQGTADTHRALPGVRGESKPDTEQNMVRI
jgi:hypothetical protein